MKFVINFTAILISLAVITLIISCYWCGKLPANTMPANIKFAVGVFIHGAWVCGAFALYAIITDKPRVAL